MDANTGNLLLRCLGISICICCGVESISFAASNCVNQLKVVALSGQQAPGAPAGTVFTHFGSPIINNKGQTAFIGSVADPSSMAPIQTGIWSEGAGSLQMTAMEQVQPLGVQFDRVGLNFAFNDRGEVAFLGSIGEIPVREPQGTNIWIGMGGSLKMLASRGDPISFEGSHYDLNGFTRPMISRQGHVAFIAASPDFSSSIWTAIGNNLSLIAQTRTEPFKIYEFLWRLPLINATGKVAFSAQASGPLSYSGIWSTAHGSLQLVARTDVPAPGLDGTRFDTLLPMSFDARGDITFFSRLAGQSVTLDNNQSLWKHEGGQVRLIARENDQAPGLPTGFVFSNLIKGPGDEWRIALDDRGDLAFRAELRDTRIALNNRSSIWRERKGELQLAFQTGIQAPDAPDTDVTFQSFEMPHLSHAGRMAFSAHLTGPGIDSTNSVGIWAEDAQGQFRLIAREGDVIDVDPAEASDLRTISELRLVGNLFDSIDTRDHESRGEGGQPYVINNLGQVAFQSVFTDRTRGIFISNLVAVPEPAAALQTSIGGIVALMALFRYVDRNRKRVA